MPDFSKDWIVKALAIGGAILTVVGLFDLFSGPYFDRQAREEQYQSHVEKIVREDQSERASSINIFFSLVNSDQLNGYSNDWLRFSEIWTKHALRLEQQHSDLAFSVRSGTASAGESSKGFCRQVDNIGDAHTVIYEKVSQIRGLNILEGGSTSIFGQALGPTVAVPSLNNTRLLMKNCAATKSSGIIRLLLSIAVSLAGLVIVLYASKLFRQKRKENLADNSKSEKISPRKNND